MSILKQLQYKEDEPLDVALWDNLHHDELFKMYMKGFLEKFERKKNFLKRRVQAALEMERRRADYAISQEEE